MNSFRGPMSEDGPSGKVAPVVKLCPGMGVRFGGPSPLSNRCERLDTWYPQMSAIRKAVAKPLNSLELPDD